MFSVVRQCPQRGQPALRHRRLSARPEKNNPYSYWSSDWGGERFEFTHPVLYLAAGKHHQYFSTSWNHVIYGAGSCCDDVAGDGDRVLPEVITGSRYHNVGERNAQLIDNLGFLRLPGECAWCGKPFRGGLADDEGASTDMQWADPPH